MQDPISYLLPAYTGGNQLDERRLRGLIILNEAQRLKPYKDSRGYWTIGIGCLIKWPALVGALNGGAELEIGVGLAKALMEFELATAAGEINRQFGGLDMAPARRAALVDMAYNLGGVQFREFVRLSKAVRNGDWAAAARHALDSRWAGQVGPRAKRIADMLETGDWPQELQT